MYVYIYMYTYIYLIFRIQVNSTMVSNIFPRNPAMKRRQFQQGIACVIKVVVGMKHRISTWRAAGGRAVHATLRYPVRHLPAS